MVTRWPDVLTLSRILLTPIVVGLWLTRPISLHWVGLAIFIVAGLTDFFDGRIARHLKQTTRFGGYVDPLADKILVLGTASVLVFAHELGVWWYIIVLTRELAVTTLRSVLKPGTTMPASRLAKWKTVSQLFAIGAAAVLHGFIPGALMGLSLALTVITGGQYIRHFWHSIET